MPATTVTITTPDGRCPATLHTQSHDAPAAAVILYPDAGGTRKAFQDKATTLAGLGYTVLLPDIYYRHGTWRPFEMSTVWDNAAERQRLMDMARSLTSDQIASDGSAFIDFLADSQHTSGTRVGVCGYCGGGRMAFIVAGRHPDRVAAVGAIHAGQLVTDAPDSPHLLAKNMNTVTVYIGAADNDPMFTTHHADILNQALSDAGAAYTLHTYSAPHGFAISDGAHYDPEADAHHWSALNTLFHSALGTV
jgi:carboxymethylenebutenolidase